MSAALRGQRYASEIGISGRQSFNPPTQYTTAKNLISSVGGSQVSDGLAGMQRSMSCIVTLTMQ